MKEELQQQIHKKEDIIKGFQEKLQTLEETVRLKDVELETLKSNEKQHELKIEQLNNDLSAKTALLASAEKKQSELDSQQQSDNQALTVLSEK